MLPANTNTIPRQSQAGFTLLEVLVAVIVLSAGLLGLAQLHTLGLRNTTSATLRTDAVNLANDILERMRVNRNSALAGNYDVAIGADSNAGGLAEDDITAWKDDMDEQLPNGDGAIVTNAGIITVTVQWSESWDEDLGGNPAQVQLRSQP